jgi:hypothetical protein
MRDEPKKRTVVREPAKVVMHLDGGYTRISLTRIEGLGIADGGVLWDIPTEAIPFNLRRIGSQFLVIQQNVDKHDSPEQVRHIRDQIEIRELTAQDGVA